ncbi:MAG: histone deacetylase [Pirellulales bacterium]|nr:histone deacetylase [Pirellulales bacterium]
MLLYRNDFFLQHQTGQHPECPARLEAISKQLQSSQLLPRCEQPQWEPSTDAQLGLVHDVEYAASVRSAFRQGVDRLDSDTVISERSFEVAALAAGAAVDAVRRVVTDEDRQALCLVRPPGHHALKDRAMGFCLFGSVAVAAAFAVRELGLNRVLIVDWDVHHGNGTQDLFWSDPQVAFFSAHRFPFYPGSGRRDETGLAAGSGTTHNLPIRFGTSREDILAQFASELEEFAAKTKPELILLSAGFDAHAADPVGSLGLEVEDFVLMTETVCDLADDHCRGRIVSILEGGYHPQMLAESVEAHLKTMLDRL